MTKRKAIAIFFMLILIMVLFTGCTSNLSELLSKSSDSSYAMIRMPDGSIIQGTCSYNSFGYCDAIVVIDGVTFYTGADNVVIWE